MNNWVYWVKLTEKNESLGEFGTNDKDCWLLMVDTFQYVYRENGIQWGSGRRVKVEFGAN